MRRTYEVYDRPAEEVLSSATLRKVDLFVNSSQAQGRNKETCSQDASLKLPSASGSQFVVDGFGRWKEIPNRTPNSAKVHVSSQGLGSTSTPTQTADTRKIIQTAHDQSLVYPSRKLSSEYQQRSVTKARTNSLAHSESKLEENVNISDSSDHNGRSSSSSIRSTYKILSTALRSNTFPGQGKSNWESSMKKAFANLNVPPPWFEKQFFGINKDSFMEWSEHDVYRQKLMMAWAKHQEELKVPAVSRRGKWFSNTIHDDHVLSV